MAAKPDDCVAEWRSMFRYLCGSESRRIWGYSKHIPVPIADPHLRARKQPAAGRGERCKRSVKDRPTTR